MARKGTTVLCPWQKSIFLQASRSRIVHGQVQAMSTRAKSRAKRVVMKIVCPSCGAVYQVPQALLARRHALKCSACGVKWRIGPPDHDGAAPAKAEPAPVAAPVVAGAAAVADMPQPHATPPAVPPEPETQPAEPEPEPEQAAVHDAAQPEAAGSQAGEPEQPEQVAPPEPVASAPLSSIVFPLVEQPTQAAPTPEPAEPAETVAVVPAEPEARAQEEENAQQTGGVAPLVEEPEPPEHTGPSAPATRQESAAEPVAPVVAESPAQPVTPAFTPVARSVSPAAPQAAATPVAQDTPAREPLDEVPVAEPEAVQPTKLYAAPTDEAEPVAPAEPAVREGPYQPTVRPDAGHAVIEHAPDGSSVSDHHADAHVVDEADVPGDGAWPFDAPSTNRRLDGARLDLRQLVQSPRFWWGAWAGSVLLSVFALFLICHWWNGVVQIWPAAGRLHLPG